MHIVVNGRHRVVHETAPTVQDVLGDREIQDVRFGGVVLVDGSPAHAGTEILDGDTVDVMVGPD